MHGHANFHDWLSQHNDYMNWEDDQDGTTDASTYSFLNSLDASEVQALQEEYDAYCEEMDKDHPSTMKDKDDD